jgi:hypothetical protein
MCHALEGREMHEGFWLGNPKAKDHLEEPDIDRRIILT